MNFKDTELEYGNLKFSLKVNHFSGMLSLTHRFLAWNSSIKGIMDVALAGEMSAEEAVEMFASIVAYNHRCLDWQLENLCLSLHRQNTIEF